MKITKKQLKRIIKEEALKLKLLEATPGAMGIAAAGGGSPADQGFAAAAEEDRMRAEVDQIIQQGRSFFDKVIQLSQASEDDPAAQAALDKIEDALSDDVEKRSYGYVKFKLI